MTENLFLALIDELTQWRALGLRCEFWWRDDDLVTLTPRLRSMQMLSEKYNIDVLVAIIPKLMIRGLGQILTTMPSLVPCQHGFAHVSHAVPSAPKSEFPETRSSDLIESDLVAGLDLLYEEVGKALLPILVPPWNAFREDMIEDIAALGYLGISQYEPVPKPCSGRLPRADVCIDVVDWASVPSASVPRRQKELVVSRIVGNLQKRRLQGAEGQPLGIVTHHRVMDDDSWQFMDELLRITNQSASVTWASPAHIFGAG